MQRMGVLEKELLVVMATYEFRCCGITQEITVSIREQLPKPKCSVCNGDMARIYNTTPAIFKAKGFYSTDGK
jgi:predicted nucleic acid-binding Zn ribbon protein